MQLAQEEILDMEKDHQTNTPLLERVWHCIRIYRTHTGRTQLKNSSMHIHPKTRNRQLRSVVVECKKHGEEHTSSFISDSALRISRLNIMTALEQSRGDRLYGQAPRGSLERKALDPLLKLGVQIDKPIGSWLCSTCTVGGGDSPLSLCHPPWFKWLRFTSRGAKHLSG